MRGFLFDSMRLDTNPGHSLAEMIFILRRVFNHLLFFQWQEDMQELLEDQMNRKMRAAQAQSKLKSGNDSDSSQATNERKKSKLFSFLKLGQT